MAHKVTHGELRVRRLVMEVARGRRAKRRKPARPVFPTKARLAYINALQSLVREVEEIIRADVLPQLDRLVAQGRALRPDHRMDAVDEEIERIFGPVRVRIAQRITDQRKRRIAQEQAREIDAINRAEVERQMLSTLGISLGSEPAIAGHLASFVKENVRLITTIPEQLLGEVEGIIHRGIQRGRLSSDIGAEISERFGVARSKAALIARDQVSSLNGELTQLRQTSLGITKYTWRTSRDERVRGNPDGKYPDAEPSHYDREGQVFSWAEPPEDGHPGEPINCRCTAEPVLDDLLDAL